MTGTTAPTAFGLIIIGNEILDGRVTDRHFATCADLLKARHLALAYALYLPDEVAVIDAQLRWAFDRPEPFFCCGGIGSTPDDLTRGCAARVTGVPLENHPEGERILKERFGEEATPIRLRMIEFPKGSALVPNPVNRIPGFSIRHGYFLPGFPSMAAPMMQWVLETCYPAGARRVVCTVLLPGAKEADLADIMDAFVAAHPELSFSSLPRFVPTGTEVELGLKGLPEDVVAGKADLLAALEANDVTYEVLGSKTS